MRERKLFPDRTFLERADHSLPVRLVYAEGADEGDIGRLQAHIKNTFNKHSFVEHGPSQTPRSVSILVGSFAIIAELGRKITIDDTRRGVVWQDTPAGRVPAYWVHSQSTCRENKFIGRDFLADIAFAVTDKTPAPHYCDRFYVVETVNDASFVDWRMRAAPWCVYDCETAGVVFSEYFEIHCLAVSTAYRETYVWQKASLQNRDIMAPLLAWMCDPTCKKVGHNLKFDMHAVKSFFGVPVNGLHSDTRLKRKVIDATVTESSLEVCSDLVGCGGYKQEFAEALKEAKATIRQARAKVNEKQMNLFDWDGATALKEAITNKKAKTEVYAYALVDEDVTALYCARDAFATAQLEKWNEAEFDRNPSCRYVWESLMRDAATSFEQIEQWGIRVDRSALTELQEYLARKREELKETIRGLGLENPDSSQQVSKYLFETLGLKSKKKSKTTNALSTDSSVLKALQNQHPDVAHLVEYRRLSKLASAYGNSLHKYIRGDDRIHPEFKLDGTETGRLSCKNPGLHQIPKSESEEGKMIKNCFIAADGHKLISLDYSQMELRIAAMLSGDEVIRDLFNSGEDFHMATAKLIAPVMWGIDPSECTKKHRSVAKCFHGETEVLTRRGWVRLRDLQDTVEIAAAKVCDHGVVQLHWETPQLTWRVSDNLVHLKTEGIDLRVTPDHRMAAWRKTGEAYVTTPMELSKARYWANAGHLLEGELAPSDDDIRRAVALQADGSFTKYGARFGFTKERKVTRFLDLFAAEVQSHYTYKPKNIRHNLCKHYRVRGELTDRAKLLLDKDKTFSWSLLTLTSEKARVFLDELRYWDGSSFAGWRGFQYFSRVEKNVDVVQAIASTNGLKTYKRQNKSGGWVLSIKDHALSRGGNVRVNTVTNESGIVYCVTTTTDAVLVRDGGIPVVTHQCFNFGLLYGMTKHGLAERLQITVDEAVQLRKVIMGKWQKLSTWLDMMEQHCNDHGSTYTLWQGQYARTRKLYDIASTNKGHQMNARNGSVNSPVQGLASDYCLASINEIIKQIRSAKIPAKLVLTVHDSIILEAKNEHADQVARQVKAIMLSWPAGIMTLQVDCDIGDRWGSLTERKDI